MKKFPKTPTTYDNGNSYLFELHNVPFKAIWKDDLLTITHRFKKLSMILNSKKIKFSFKFVCRIDENNIIYVVKENSNKEGLSDWSQKLLVYLNSEEGSILIQARPTQVS